MQPRAAFPALAAPRPRRGGWETGPAANSRSTSSRSPAPSASVLLATRMVLRCRVVSSSTSKGSVPTSSVWVASSRWRTASTASATSSLPRSATRSAASAERMMLGDPGFEELRGDRRQVDELDGHVLPHHDPWLRRPGRERIRGDFRVCMSQGREECALARVRRSDQHDLAGPLVRHPVAHSPLLAASRRRPLELILEPAHLLLQVRLELLGALVLGKQPVHLAELFEPLGGRRCPAEFISAL